MDSWCLRFAMCATVSFENIEEPLKLLRMAPFHHTVDRGLAVCTPHPEVCSRGFAAMVKVSQMSSLYCYFYAT